MQNVWMVTRQPLLDLLFVLVTVLGVSLLYGRRAEPISLAGLELKQPDLSDWFEAPPPAELVPPLATASSNAVASLTTADARTLAVSAPRGGDFEPLEAGKARDSGEKPVTHRVLMLGDSMIEPLQQRAAAYFRAAGYKFISVVWYGSRTLDWGRGSRLGQTLQTYAPTYVIVVLGSNELMARDVAQRAAHVRSMLKTFGELPVIWVGPPSWREDHGFNAMLATELGEHFFRSEALSFERKSDGIHPTDAAGAYWMDRVADWLRSRPDHSKLVLMAPTHAARHHAPARVWPPPGR
jgi:hypothetical protein